VKPILLAAGTLVGAAGAASAIWAAVGGGPVTDAQARTAGTSSSGKSSTGSSSAGTSSAGDTVVVCVGSDSMMRAVNGSGCPTGQTLLDVNCAGCGAEAGQDARHMQEELAELDRRVKQVHKSSLFTVIDKEGHPIFSVGEDRVSVYYANSESVRPGRSGRVPADRLHGNTGEAAWIGENGEAVFGTRSANGRFATHLGAPDSRPRFWIEEGGFTRLEVGKNSAGSSGRYSMKIPGLSGSGVTAGIGETVAGTGAVIVGGIDGKTKASMIIADGKPMVGVYNGEGVAIAALTIGASDGGLFTLGGANGAPMVKMGVKNDRYGVVLAGPGAGFPLVPKSGLPGSYFLGCAGGPGCEP
jgi:hypothetical protein